ncbi:hypothetical protein RHSIM_Rhsim04G0236000 [Rhododendron simsii]|uniref:Jacalin-type lectin domain-containing protein n=1 Tax=Rhododendron simsii TaxID=118357 RepID=A0A834LRS5_RHOSS|nr:hypothetical protein RHSIM_Rhsim04G0236000 [Rhododendron simsii]
MIKIGPVGRTNGRGISAWNDGGKEKIVQIFIAHGDWIYSLQYLYVDQNGNLVLSDSHGTTASSETSKFDVVKLDYPSEFITGISGIRGCHGTASIFCDEHILSITFTTNKRTYGPFGGPGGGDSAFRYQLGPDRPFGGFHGYSSGRYLEAIGLYVKPLTTLSNDQEKVKNEKV